MSSPPRTAQSRIFIAGRISAVDSVIGFLEFCHA
jgi:hypothetical protein